MLSIHKFAIGTTKFGMNYGFGNNHRQVLNDDVSDIFALCQAKNVNMFDTAPSYGNAEELLGLGRCATYAHIVTKVSKIDQLIVNADTLHRVKKMFDQSLQNMQVEQVYGLLIHDVSDLAKPNAKKLVDLLLGFKNAGSVNKIGVSLYKPEEARKLFELYPFDLIQIPYNLFDQRFMDTGTIEWLQNKGVEIHARSLFLKGLLLKPNCTGQIPNHLHQHHQQFHQYMKKIGMNAYDACMLFAKHNSQIDKWVIGVSSKTQLKKLLNWRASSKRSFDFSSWSLDDEKAIDPRFW